MKDTQISVSSIRLLNCIAFLEEQGLYGNSTIIAKIMRGEGDMETIPLAGIRSFGSVPSISKRKIKARLKRLVASSLIEERESRFISGGTYLVLTQEGRKYVDYSKSIPSASKKETMPNTIRIAKGENSKL